MNLLDVSPVGFQNQMFLRLVSLLQVLRVGMLDMGLQPLALQEYAPYLCNPSYLCVTALGRGFLLRLGLCLSYLSQCNCHITFFKMKVYNLI